MTAPLIHPAAASGFASNADDYERTRPGYPASAVAFLIDTLGLRQGVSVADVAAGTGKLTRLLLPSGARVVAVEPVPEMRAFLSSTCPGAEVLDGTAEDLPLTDASVDAITVAQAFHWFDGPRALASFARVLKPAGQLAVVYNHRARDVPWLAAVNALVEVHRNSTPQQWDGQWASVFEGDIPFTAVARAEFENRQQLTASDFIGRIRSMSYVGALPVEAREALLASIASLLATHPETVGRDELSIAQQTSVHVWRRR